MEKSLCLLVLFSLLSTLSAAPRDADWKKAAGFIEQQKPQSAIDALKPIEAAAIQDKAWAEAAKAIGMRIALEGQIQGNKPAEKITRMEVELKKAPAEMQPVLETIQAFWFNEYFQRNRWRFMQRTQLAQPSGEDIETWDLKRILTEIDARFQKALAVAPSLKQVPVAQWDALLEKEGLPDSYQPALYDFIVRHALDFYTMAEQAGAAAEDAFEFDAASPALGTQDEFLAWRPQSTDAASPRLRAVKLFQELIAFHKDDADPGARVLADLERIEWAAEEATGTGPVERKKQLITTIYQNFPEHEISLRARAEAAQDLIAAHKPVEALALLNEGVAKFGKSIFAPRCRNMIKSIEDKELKLSTEMIWNSAGPEIAMEYRNITKAFFRLYLVEESPKPLQTVADWRNSDLLLRGLLLTKPAQVWSTVLPATTDRLTKNERIPVPPNLKPGLYVLGASGDEAFSASKNMIAVARVWVTPLALVTRTRAGMSEGWVLDAISGDPVSGAEVTLWHEQSSAWKKAGTAKTGADGFVSFKSPADSQSFLFATHDGHSVPSDLAYNWRNEVKLQDTATFFFTDRALYRPGQTIQFKGIRAQFDGEKSNYQTLEGQQRHLVLKDMNNREVASLDATSNAWGSFSGSFTAPRTGVTGPMVIEDAGQGSAHFRVEEYKRPKFKVEIDAPASAAKLGEEVSVNLRALAYTGAPVDGATVKWHVTRAPQFPSWIGRCWWFVPQSGSNQQIAHGDGKTGAGGTFEIKFPAVPDKTIDEKSEPWFSYSVHADVTDTAGETRSGDRSLNAGYTALKADLSASDWQTTDKPVEITVRTTTLDGEPQKAEGTLVVHRLAYPDKVHRPRLEEPGRHYYARSNNSFNPPEQPPEKDLSKPDAWELGEVVQRDNFGTDDKGAGQLLVKLAAGAYRAVLETRDRFGKKVTALLPLTVIDPSAAKFPVPAPFWLGAPAWRCEPGSDLSGIWGTGYEKGRAFIEIEHRHKIVQRFWTDAARTQQSIPFKAGEEHRGGFTLHITQVHDNRARQKSVPVEVPWSNKELTLKWEHLTSKLDPGAKETWTLTIAGPGSEKAAAEMAATLYDASLDAFSMHSWMRQFNVFYRDFSDAAPQGFNGWMGLDPLVDNWSLGYEGANERTRHFPSAVAWASSRQSHSPRRRFVAGEFDDTITRGLRYGRDAISGNAIDALMEAESTAAPMLSKDMRRVGYSSNGANLSMVEAKSGSFAGVPDEVISSQQPGPDLDKVSARQNLNETAFFFPQLTSDENGAVKMTFTMPEALTTWKFFGFAHDKALRSGFIEAETVTARDLMVQPNPPRFLREGDVVEFTVKLTNQSDKPQTGKARLTFADAATLKNADAGMGHKTPEQSFEVPAKESRTVSWRVTVPDGQGFLTWKAVAATDKLADGEEGWLPVLSRRILVTESLPLPIRNAGEKEFNFKKLVESAGSDTLKHQNLTIQMVSQPAWYAVMALPYLMEYPHECSEQTFNRLYANALARHIAQSDPKIRRVFDIWRDAQPEALESPLMKNQDLKSVMIEETPWLRHALNETQQRKNIGILFDDNRLDSETTRLIQRLKEAQLPSGLWPWFPGGNGNEFITLYIVTGFGRMQHLGVAIPDQLALQSLDALDAWLDREYREILKHHPERKDDNHFHSTIALYLYGRSFFIEKRPVQKAAREALDYYLGQAKKYWTGVPRMSQAHAALGLLRFGDKETPAEILASIKEYAVSNEELGMFWRDTEETWWWHRAPIETQAMMIEAFRDIAKDEKAVDDCQVWLLKQKQTQAWPTTKSTADAVYALLLGGSNQLASDALVTVSLGGAEVKPEKIEAGTGFYEKKFSPAEIKADMGNVKLVKTDKGVSWGSLHWQYLEDMRKVTPHEGTPLKVTKTLFTKVDTKAGPELRPVQGKVKVGDELVVRVEIRTDRDMEFVHLKDQRPGSVEPVNVLSRYKWQDGLGYYESTRDTASHFFIDYLRKGTYVFEYSTRVQLRGSCQTGIAELQCMYAPEFNSHSQSFTLDVE